MESQPHVCMYCGKAGSISNVGSVLNEFVCLDWSNRKVQKIGNPDRVDYRYYLKLVGGLETCDQWMPLGHQCTVKNLGLAESVSV